MENFKDLAELINKEPYSYGLKVVYAVVILIVGLWIIKIISKLIGRILEKRNFEESLKSFTKSFLSITLKTLLVISVISMLGVQMTSFIAILGAAGLAIGMAFSGMLQNFAGGVMILVFKPFKVGDFIDGQGHSGSVKEIQIFNTILKTPDNKTIIIPNGGLATNSMINYSAEPERRVDLVFGISYSDDIDKARSVIKDVIKLNDKVKKMPEPFIAVSELADSSVNFAVRLWTETIYYWDVYFYMQEMVKKSFDKEGVSIPFPQTDVHIHQTT